MRDTHGDSSSATGWQPEGVVLKDAGHASRSSLAEILRKDQRRVVEGLVSGRRPDRGRGGSTASHLGSHMVGVSTPSVTSYHGPHYDCYTRQVTSVGGGATRGRHARSVRLVRAMRDEQTRGEGGREAGLLVSARAFFLVVLCEAGANNTHCRRWPRHHGVVGRERANAGMAPGW